MKKFLSSLVVLITAGLLCLIFFSKSVLKHGLVDGVVELNHDDFYSVLNSKDYSETELSSNQNNSEKKYSETDSDLKLYFFDVGQGDSAMIKKGNWEMIIDGGPDKSILEKLGKYLSYTDNKIEVIILTHAHADHVNGLVEIMERYQIGKVYFNGAIHSAPGYLEFLKIIKDKNIETEIIDRPQELSWDNGLKIKFLTPIKSFYQIKPENINNSSLVFRLIYNSSTALFMGDFEDEETLISFYQPEDLKSQILKIGHHGSNNANSKEFIAAISPYFAIISCGKNNSFGHPHYRTLYNLEKNNSKILRTDILGDIFFISSASGFKLKLLD